jgi:hypothetical protein
MHTAQQIRAAFADVGLVTFPAAAVERLGLPLEDCHWLTGVGLPRQAAPFLSFGGKHEMKLPTLSQLLGVSESIGGSRYRAIGSNGSGDPIVIDLLGQCAVWYLNHDLKFAPVFINSSIRALAACLLAYRKLGAACREAFGDDAFLEQQAPAGALEAFVAEVALVDPAALPAHCMWGSELAQFGGTPGAV